MAKGIVLCADDYGQAPAITDGILALALKNRLSAVSCMVNAPFWREAAAALLDSANHIDIGLHFNLTEGAALSAAYQAAYGATFLPINRLLQRSILRSINPEVIAAELEAQLDAFQAAIGRVPRFIDGHQHVHQFPAIRNAFLAVYEKRLRADHVYVRLANPRLRSFKQLIIKLSSAGFAGRLKTLQVPHNTSFSGSYAFGHKNDYRGYFLAFLDEVNEQGMIMCHPALKGLKSQDSIAEARFNEYLYLASDQFLEDCSLRGVKIEQFKAIINSE